jgi:hypothetical protein
MSKAIELIETRRGCALLETHPRYEVRLHGKRWGELYFNMRGYTGYLPLPNGHVLDIGERGISAFRKEVGKLNREWAAAGPVAIEPRAQNY